MDPNEMLENVRALIRDERANNHGELEDPEGPAAAFERLDQWMSEGYDMPDAWKRWRRI